MANPFAARSLLVAGACVGLLAMAAPVAAQDRMDKPVRILVGFAPGGTADLIARVVADKLKDTIGQPVVCREPSRSRRQDRGRRGQGRGAGRRDDHGDAHRSDGGGAAHT